MSYLLNHTYDWTNPKVALEEMKVNILSAMKVEEDWYIKHRKRHGRFTRAIRVTSILLFAIGLLWPIVKKHFPSVIKEDIDIGYISLAIGGLLLLLDKYLGISTGFVRFYIAELDIKKNTLEFVENWQIETVRATNLLTPDSILSLINTLKTFRQAVYTTIQVETGAWSSEFQSQTGELYELFKQKQTDYKLGNISVNLKNHTGYTNIEIGLDDRTPILLNDKTSTIFRNVSLEPHLILIRASKDGNNFIHSENADVLGDKTTEIIITLP